LRTAKLVVLLQDKLNAGQCDKPSEIDKKMLELLELLHEVKRFYLKTTAKSKLQRLLKPTSRSQKVAKFTKELDGFYQDFSILVLCRELDSIQKRSPACFLNSILGPFFF